MTHARHLQPGDLVYLPDDDVEQIVVSVTLSRSRPGEVIVETNSARFLPETAECVVVAEPFWVDELRRAVR